MAAPTTEVRSADFVVTAGGNVIAGRKGGSIQFTRGLLDTTGFDDDKWYTGTAQARTVRMPFQGVYVDNSVKLAGCPTLKINDSGVAVAALEQMKSVSLRCTTEMAPIENCSNSDDNDFLPDMRTVDIDFVCDYLDPAAATVQTYAWNDYELDVADGPKIDWEFDLGIGGTGGTNYPQFSGSGIVYNLTVDTSGKIATLSGSIRVTGAVTFTDGVGSDTALLALIRSVFPSTATDDPGSLAVIFAYENESDALAIGTAGSTQWTFTAYVPTLEITMAYGEPSQVSCEFLAAGAVTRTTAAT